MKITRYLAIAVAIAAAAAVVAWLLRNTIIERISGPMLDDYGLEIVDVSLDALATSNASIGYLELAHRKGTTIAIEDLTLPIGTPTNRIKAYTASKVSIITATRTDGEPFEIAPLIAQYLSLADVLSETEVIVGELELAPYPVLKKLRWITRDGRQRLTAMVGNNQITTEAFRTAPNSYSGSVTLQSAITNATIQEIDMEIRHVDTGFEIIGGGAVDLAAWVPLITLYELMPARVGVDSAPAVLNFNAVVPNDVTITPSVTATVVPATEWRLTYSGAPEKTTRIRVESGSQYEINATFPDVRWGAKQDRSKVIVTYADWTDIPVSLTDLDCQSGLSCTLNSVIKIASPDLPIGTLAQLEAVSSQRVTLTNGLTQVAISPDARLSIVDFVSADRKLARFDAHLVSEATMEIDAAGWKFGAESVDAEIRGLAIADAVSLSAPVFLETVMASRQDEDLSASTALYVPSSRAALGQANVLLPGIRGNLSLKADEMAADLQTVGLYEEGTIGALFDLENGTGELLLNDAAVSFTEQELADRISPWRNRWNLSAGIIFVDLQATWEPAAWTGRASIEIDDLAGFYADTAFAGLSTRLGAHYDKSGPRADPAHISVALIDMGVPIEDLSADYTLDIGELAIAVENLRMSAFGGTVRAEPFSFHTARASNTVILHAASIELAELLSMDEFEAIQVSGSIGARLPVTIEGKTITISGGTLEGEPAGGVIRYRPGSEPDEADVSGIGVATRILRNFEFDTLASDVNYSSDGDLILQMKLTGRNPDLDEARPVVLNLGIENNVPEMLRSLQAARTVEEILERRLRQ